jgi:hypothetical protein
MRPKPPPAVRVSGGRNARFADSQTLYNVGRDTSIAGTDDTVAGPRDTTERIRIGHSEPD